MTTPAAPREGIEPALTAEEWGKLERTRRCQFSVSIFHGNLFVDNDQDETASLHGPPEDRHAIAALALHGQPYGFTWEDVTMLDEFADAIYLSGVRPGPMSRAVRALRDRIAALLPPR